MESVHPISLGLTLLLGVILLAVPRRHATLPVVVAVVFLPVAQRIVIGEFDFTMLRILVLFAAVRMGIRGEYRGLRLLTVDVLLLGFIAAVVLAYTLREFTVVALVNRLGWAFDAVGIYIYCRSSLRSPADVLSTIRTTIACSVVVAAFMGAEWFTGRNLFSTLGGVPEWSMVRNGRLRAQGAFSHPILAGIFGASWVPLAAALWVFGQRGWAVAGVGAGVAITLFSSSSTPVAGLAFGIMCLGIWRLRHYVPLALCGLLVVLVVLHFVRRTPVWHLISRIDLIGGSTGYHRYRLIDACIRNFWDWWLVGTDSTMAWGVYLGDVTNEYVLTAVRGGLLSLLLMLATMAVAFTGLGRAATSRLSSPKQRFFAWAAVCTFAVHSLCFIAVSYFGQLRAVWYMHLAMVAASIQWHQVAIRRRRAERRRSEAPLAAQTARV